MEFLATIEEVEKVCLQPQYVNYCALWDRPGLLHWMVELEYTKFKPDTDANDDFHLSIMRWPDDVGLLYAVITFHKKEQEWAESRLWENGLRKVTEGFTQIILGGGKAQQFPLSGDNIFFLENHSQGAANVIYANDPKKREEAHKHEMALCQPFFDEHTKWINTPEGEAIANEYWSRHPEGRVR
jgi:hypothetical protein